MQQIEEGAVVEGKVTGITKFGAFVDLGDNKSGMVHISEVSSAYVENIEDFVKMGQTVKVKVLTVNEEGKISLSMKKAEPPRSGRRPAAEVPDRPTGGEWETKQDVNMSFEDMMSKFKKTSDDKFLDLKRKNNSDIKRNKRSYSK